MRTADEKKKSLHASKQVRQRVEKQVMRNMNKQDNPALAAQGPGRAVTSHFRLIWDYFLTNLASAMEYRVSFLTQAVGMAINDVFFLFFWWMVFQQTGNLGGYGFRDVMSIWALSASTFGLLHIVFGNVGRINAIVQSGELDIFLLQPRDPFIHLHAARMNFSAWGDFVYAIILFFAISGWNPGKWLLFLIFTIAGALLLGAVLSMADALVFYWGDSSGVTRLVTEFMLNFSLYPDSIFRPGVKWVIYTVLPTAFVVFVPYRLMLAFNLPVCLGVLAIDIGAVILARQIFKAGLKRYASGSKMGARM
jgi:ABC-2 type transport system permease protein